MTSDLNLFERPAEICYCVGNGTATCTPCRERRAGRNAQIEVVQPDTSKHPFQWLLDALPEPGDALHGDHNICWNNGQSGNCNNDCSVFLAGRCDAQADGAEYFVHSPEGRAWAMERIEDDADEEVYRSIKAMIADQRALDGGVQ